LSGPRFLVRPRLRRTLLRLAGAFFLYDGACVIAAAAMDGERQIYLKMASVWLHAAVEFESGTSTEGEMREDHRRRMLGE
jgi:hypothetical protein